MLINLTSRLRLNSESFLFLILLGFSLFSSAFQVIFSYGITFTFASIFLFLIFRLYGIRLAIFATLLTFLLIPHHYIDIAYNLILVGEVLFVGTYFHIKKRAKMFFVDAFFWLTIGLGAIFFLNYSTLTGDALYFQIFKDILNGLFNILIADMLLAYLPFYKLLNKSIRLNKNNVSFHQLLSHITILSIMVPFFLIILTKTLSANVYQISQYQDLVLKEFLIYIKLSILFLLIIVIIALVINRLFMNNLKQLIMVTTGLPQKLNNLEKIDWPQAYISELRLLSQNLKEMAYKIRELFQESKEMNKLLTSQTKKLQESEDKLHQLAYYDVLTSLPNRLHFQNFVKSLIKNNPDQSMAIIFIDLNKFKQVNDIFGHCAGDILLQLTANRLCNIKDYNIEVFRLGGDEFVTVHQFDNREEVCDTIEKIRFEFSSPFTINEHVLNITGSVGVSLYPDDGPDLDTLVRCADIAMYVSKESVLGTAQFFQGTMCDQLQKRLLLENSLRKTVDQGGFQLVYQPKIKSGVVSSLEALLRWNDPVLGYVAPSKFIPIAEEIGIISQIDEWTLVEACRQNKKWQDEGLLKVPISVNISAKNFQHDQLIFWIEKALSESGMSPQYLKLEITESVFIKNTNYVAHIINQIKNLGILISIDDFGKGYSSLMQLLQLPIDEIKIDLKFIKGIDQNEKQQLVVKSLIDMAHGLNLNIVAEGIEVTAERDILLQMRCDELQGYLFSPPLSQIEVKKFLNMNTLSQTSSNGGSYAQDEVLESYGKSFV